MATKNVRETDDQALAEEARAERADIALKAAWELESIAEALIQAARGLSAEDLVIRSLSIRAKDLAQVMISAIDDESHETAELRQRLTGIREPGPDAVAH